MKRNRCSWDALLATVPERQAFQDACDALEDIFFSDVLVLIVGYSGADSLFDEYEGRTPDRWGWQTGLRFKT